MVRKQYGAEGGMVEVRQRSAARRLGDTRPAPAPPTWHLSSCRRCRYPPPAARSTGDRKSTRLNSSHLGISYAVFCLKKKQDNDPRTSRMSSCPAIRDQGERVGPC